MNANMVLAICALLGALLSLVGVIYVAAVKLTRIQVEVERIPMLEKRVNAIWEFLLRRGKSEAVISGLMDVE